MDNPEKLAKNWVKKTKKNKTKKFTPRIYRIQRNNSP
jgi:hypothetical protein